MQAAAAAAAEDARRVDAVSSAAASAGALQLRVIGLGAAVRLQSAPSSGGERRSTYQMGNAYALSELSIRVDLP